MTAHQAGGEPIAIIGIGCRFAGGADTPDRFWDLLVSGRDGIGELPEGRWDGYRERGPKYAAALRNATARGGFLGDIAGFDAAFFGLSPREAELMDPQQRLLLELTWEALEHAGVLPHSLAGGDTGVFVGVGSDDYGRRMLEDLPTIEAWTGIGSAMCAVANRISYALDLHGPSLAVDTACSASLVAAHLACHSLRDGECGTAVVGGVNLMVGPGLTLTLDAAGATAPDGRCKPFDAEADGYGRGEGGGVLVLRRLADALADGDRVVAVIRGSAVLQDGRTVGIMAPNGDAQRALIEQACRRSGVAPVTVDYVEAHGTGTRLGDPLEAGALGAVYGVSRPADNPCLIGSVKGSIGHLEAGAGIASLIKAALAVSNAEIPASLGCTTPNPAIDWDGVRLQVNTERRPWPLKDGPRRAGVSGFGYGGTIGHVVLEQAPQGRSEAAQDTADQTVPRGFPLSGHSPAALREYAAALADHVEEETRPDLADLGHTLALRRSHQDHRAVVVAADRESLVSGLRQVADGQQGPAVATGAVLDNGPAGPVWVFSGHGSQWPGMGRELLAADPAFSAAIEELVPVFMEEIGFSPVQVLRDADFATVDRIQTMIFAMQIGLAASWRAAGVTPAAVIGHSVGEIAAATTAGVLSIEDGARLICRRSRLLRKVAGAGAMAMLDLPYPDVCDRLAEWTDVTAAIWAGPESTVISGTPEAVEDLAACWRKQGIDVRKVDSDVAFHSAQMDPLLADLRAAVEPLTHREPQIPLYSTALTDSRKPTVDVGYWATNLRQPVRLGAAVGAAAEDGHRAFVEISGHPIVVHSIRETLSALGVDDALVGHTLRRNKPEHATFLGAVAAVHCHGGHVDWTALQPRGRLITLPPIAWQREPHWHNFSQPVAEQDVQHDVHSHTLLGRQIPVSGRPTRLWRTTLDDGSRPYPGSHTINGTEVVPAAVLIATFLDAAGQSGAYDLHDMTLRLPLTTTEHREIQVVHDEGGLHLASRIPGENTWLTHISATARSATPHRPVPAATTPLRAADPAEVGKHLASVGVPTMAFHWTVDRLARGQGAVSATATVDRPGTGWAPLLDAALSIAPLVHPGPAVLRMVSQLGTVQVSGEAPATAQIHIRPDAADPSALDVLIGDPEAGAAIRLTGLSYAGLEATETAPARPEELLHELTWQPLPAREPEQATSRTVALLGEDHAALTELCRALIEAGVECTVLSTTDGLAGQDHTDVVVLAGEATGSVAVPEAAARSSWQLLRAAQALATEPGMPDARLWCATVGVRESERAERLAGAPLWGIGRVLAGELGELWGGVVDLPPDPAAAAPALLTALRHGPGEDVMAVRDGATSVARLSRARGPATATPFACRPDASYLITGGLGVLGLPVAQWLAERGARRLVLAGRGTVPHRTQWDEVTDPRVDGIRSLEAMGVTVRTVSLDIADAAQARRVLDAGALDLPPVRGVVHAAGVLDNRLVDAVDEDSLRTVLRPKIEGAWVLHSLYPPGTLDFLALFSSCGQLLGLPGQATYGAANAFLDAFAAHRNRSGHPDTTSFGWTSWRGQGMADNAVVDRELRARGVTDISADQAFAAWDLAARTGTGHFPVLRTVPDATETLPVLADIAARVESAAPGVVADASPAAEALAEMSPQELRGYLVAEVTARIAGEMRLPADSLDIRRPLVEQGLDSVMTIVVRRGLEKTFGHKIPPTLLWHQPTVFAIVDYLLEAMAPVED